MAGMAEPMLALFDRDPDRALAILDRYAASPDPWTRAAVPLQRGAFYAMFGRFAEAESECRAALAAFREIGDPWGAAAALVQTADFAAMRADYPAAIASLEEAASLGEEVGAWGDLVHIAGKLAAVRLRMGDLAGARADLERAERARPARRRAERLGGMARAGAGGTARAGGRHWRRRPAVRGGAVLPGIPAIGRGGRGSRALAQARLALLVADQGTRRAAARCWRPRSGRPRSGWSCPRWPP